MTGRSEVEAPAEEQPRQTYWQEYYRKNKEKLLKQRIAYNKKMYEKHKNEDWFKEQKATYNKRYNEKVKERKQAEKESIQQSLERLKLLEEQLKNTTL